MGHFDWLHSLRKTAVNFNLHRDSNIRRQPPSLRERQFSSVAGGVEVLEIRELLSGVGVTAPATQSSVHGSSVSVSISGSLAFAGDSYTWSLSGNLPGSLALTNTNTLSPTLTGLITANPGTSFSAVLTLSEVHSGKQTFTASATITWTVTALPPVVTQPSDQTSNELDVVSLGVSATDPGGYPLTYSASGLPSGLTINSSTGVISGTVASGTAAGGPYTAQVTVNNGYSSTSKTLQWSVTALPIVLPGVTQLTLVNDTGTPGDLITADPRISGSLSVTGSSNAFLPVQYDIDGDGIADGTIYTNAAGDFIADLSNSSINDGAVVLQFRAGRPDSGGGTYSYGTWSSFSFTYLAAVPEISGVGLADDTGTPGDSITSNPLISGVVTIAAGSPANLTVQYDIDGDGLSDGSTQSDATGHFLVDLTSLNLALGQHTVSLRAISYTQNGTVPHYSTWSAGLTFSMAAGGNGGEGGEGGEGGGGDPPASPQTYIVHPGESFIIPNVAVSSIITNYSADPDGWNGPIGDISVSYVNGSVNVRPVAGSEFYVIVTGNASWTSERNIGKLKFEAYGNLGVSPIDGELNLRSTYGSIGAVEGSIVFAYAAESIGDVIATESISQLFATKGIGNVSCDGDAGGIESGRMHTTSTSSVTIQGDLKGIVGSWDKVTVGGSLVNGQFWDANTITIGGNNQFLSFYSSPQKITIGGSSGIITMPDLCPTLTIAGSLGFIRYGTDINGNGVWYEYTDEQSGLFLDRSSSSTNQLTASAISSITVAHDFKGKITSGGKLGTFYAQGSIDQTTIKAQGDVFWIRSGSSLFASIVSGGKIGGVYSGGTMTGSIIAELTIGQISSAGAMTASIESLSGSLPNVMSGGDFSGSVNAAIDIGWMSSAGTLSGSIKAEEGSIGSVAAVGTMSGSIEAGTTIGDVRSTSGGISSTIDAGGSINTIWAKLDIDTAMIRSGGSIGPITADTGSIRSTITATTNVDNVTAQHGDIDGGVTAGGNIRNITAGHSIGAKIEATAGNINSVVAGSDGGGNITGNITAGRTIAVVDARGIVSGPALNMSSLMSQLWSVNIQDVLLGLIPLPTFVLPTLPTIDKGKISGNIEAGHNISSVNADGSISGQVHAVGMVTTVNSGGTISGQIDSDAGSVTVSAWGQITGDINALGTIVVSALGDINNAIVSLAGGAAVATYSSINSTVKAYTGIIESALGTVAGNFESTTGDARISGIQKMLASGRAENILLTSAFLVSPTGWVYASADLGMMGRQLALGMPIQIGRDAYVYALDDGVGNITARNVSVTSWGDFTGRIDATGNITIDVHDTLSATSVKSSGGDISVKADNIQGNITTTGTSWNVNVVAWGSLTGNVTSGKNATVSAYASINGDISAGGRVIVSTFGDLTGNVSGGKLFDTSGQTQHKITSWGNLTSNITVGSSAEVFAYGNLSGNVTLSGTPDFQAAQRLEVTAMQNLTGNITSAGDAIVSIGKDFDGDITAGDDVNCTSFGVVSGDITAGSGATSTPSAPAEFNEHVAFVSALKSVTGNVTAANGVRVDAFGDIVGDMTAVAGVVEIIARVAATSEVRAGDAGIPGGFSGTVTALLHVGITAAGSISAAGGISGKAIDLQAGNGISAGTVTATNGAITAAAGGAFVATTITAQGTSGSISLSAGGNLDVTTFTAATSASLDARGTIKANGAALSGSMDVTTLAGINESHLTAAVNLAVTSFGPTDQLTGTAQTGTLALFSRGDISESPLTAYGAVSVSTLGLISGSGIINSQHGGANVYAASSIASGCAIVAEAMVSVVAGESIAADVTSRSSTTGVESHLGGVSGNIAAATGVSVTTLSGNISGDIHTNSGAANVDSAGTISGNIQSDTGAVNAFAMGSISSPSIIGGLAVTVASFAGISGAMIESTGANADVSAVGDIGAAVQAWTNAVVSSALGSVEGSVNAETGNAIVSAGADIQGSVTAAIDATVNALGSVSQTVSAGRDAVVNAAGGSVQQSVSAGRDATVFALDDVQQAVTAGRDANISAFGMVQATVSAGRNASVSAAGGIQGDVVAGVNATLFTADSLSGNVTATAGNIQIAAWGHVQTMLVAGGNADVFAGEGGSVSGDTGGSLAITAAGPLQVTVDAGTSADILASGVISGVVSADTDATVIGFSSTSVSVTAGENALIFSGQSLQGNVTGGLTAAAVSMGTISGSQITGSQSAMAYAIGTVTSVTVQGDSASLVSWDMVSGPSLVQGVSNAYGYGYAGFYGTVSASAGSASLITLGSVPSGTTVTASGDAVAMSAGSFAGSVSAGGFAGVIALQDFSGSLTAGTDAVVLSEGALSGTVSAGRDASAWSLANISGSINATRDAAIVTFGDFSGTLTAGRDVSGVGTVGDLGGTITAARNVGSLLSYATFSASVSANNSVNEVGQGQIGNVTSLGLLGGSLTAANSIGTVTSAGAVTATISAPNLGSILPNNADLVTSLITPTAPASVRSEVLADGAAALAGVQASKSDFDSSAQSFVSGIQQDRSDLLADIAQSRSDIQADNQTATSETQTDANIAQQAASDGLTADRATAATSRQAAVTDANTQQQALEASWTAVDTANQAAYAGSLADAHDAQTAAQDKQVQASTAKQSLRTQTNLNMTADQNWSSRIPSLPGTVFAIFNIPANIQGTISHVQSTYNDLVATADSVDAQGFNRFTITYAATAADLVGLRAIQGAWDGADPYTLEQWSDGYRVFQGVVGVVTLVESAMAISSVASFFLTPCRSLHWGSCFVGDTQVLTREIEDATTATAVLPDESQSAGSLDWLTPVCILIGVAGTVVLQRKTRRCLRPATVQRRSVLDSLFSNNDFDSASSSRRARSLRKSLLQPGRSEVDFAPIGEPKHCGPSKRRMLRSQSVIPNERPQTRPPVMPYESAAEVDMVPANDSSPAWRPATWTWLLMWFLLGGFCFVQSSASSWSVPTLAKEAGVRPVVAKRFESRAIQDMRTGMKVIADNPELHGQEASESKIIPATWRNIHLRMDKPDGSELKMTLLRSLDWLEERHGEIGRDIDVNLAELGAAGAATILAIEPCSLIESGSGRVVTGTFQHSAANIIDLYVTGEEKPIGTTANHPFWSEDRREFVQAGSLRPGEQLRTASDDTAFVRNIVAKTTAQSVFNLEVDAEHVYSIASRGLLVHNAYAGGGAQVSNLRPGTSLIIQNFVDHYKAKVIVVGSRAAGEANDWSDFDYLVEGNSRARRKAEEKLPRGLLGGKLDPQGNPTGIDVWDIKNTPLIETEPHIVFEPTNPIAGGM